MKAYKQTGGRILLGLALLVLLSACGRKGPILPPLERIPQAVKDLAVLQVGGELRLSWTLPTRTISDTPLEDLTTVQILKFEEVFSLEDGQIPATSAQIREQAQILLEVPKQDFAEFQLDPESSPLKFRYAYEFPHQDVGRRKFIFLLKVRDARGRFSDFSEWVSIVPINVAVPPKGLKAKPGRNRLNLTWEAPPLSLDGSQPAQVTGYNLYRALGSERPKRINQDLILETRFPDRSIEFGRTYTYWVRAVSGEGGRQAESGNSEPLEVEAQDTFAPAVPQGLLVISGKKSIALSWDSNAERDLDGYKVWRREEGSPMFRLLTPQAIDAPSFIDSEVEPGVRYEYAVSALDRNGNESERSAGQTVVIRRGKHEDLSI